MAAVMGICSSAHCNPVLCGLDGSWACTHDHTYMVAVLSNIELQITRSIIASFCAFFSSVNHSSVSQASKQ